VTNQERDALLIELRTDVKWIKAAQEKHLNHHFRYSMLAWGAVLTAIVSLATSLWMR
jgi:hypothetical protein